MPIADTSRRLRPQYIDQDVDSMHGLENIDNYVTGRLDATAEALKNAYKEMAIAQREETIVLDRAKAATDKARLAEWKFHNNVLAMKESVRGQFGSDSNEAQSVGYKKKSERKRPRRTAA
ncbi:MAG: hypothetical protein AAFW95_02495 [Cyanobacteria bacterium J06638_6]